MTKQIVGKNGLQAKAEHLADEFRGQLSALESELKEKTSEIELSRSAVDRVLNFKPELNERISTMR